jgi:hypothetical protein
MSYWELVPVVLRRWPLTVLALLLAVGAGVGGFLATPPSYLTKISLVMLTPAAGSKETGPVNPFLNFSDSLATTASVVSVIMTSPQFADEMARQGYTGVYSIGLDPSAQAPVLLVTAKDAKAAESRETAKALVEQVTRVLNTQQDLAGAPEGTWIRTSPVSNSVKPERQLKSQIRSAIGGFTGVMLVTFGGLLLLERRRLRRSGAVLTEPELSAAGSAGLTPGQYAGQNPEWAAYVPQSPAVGNPAYPDGAPAYVGRPQSYPQQGGDAPPGRRPGTAGYPAPAVPVGDGWAEVGRPAAGRSNPQGRPNGQQVPASAQGQQRPPRPNGQQLPASAQGQHPQGRPNGQQVPASAQGQQRPPRPNGQQLPASAQGQHPQARPNGQHPQSRFNLEGLQAPGNQPQPSRTPGQPPARANGNGRPEALAGLNGLSAFSVAPSSPGPLTGAEAPGSVDALAGPDEPVTPPPTDPFGSLLRGPAGAGPGRAGGASTGQPRRGQPGSSRHDD